MQNLSLTIKLVDKVFSYMMLKLIILLIVAAGYIEQVLSHGMVLNPASRSSRWRYNSSAPVNWDDNQLYCGGFGVRKSLL